MRRNTWMLGLAMGAACSYGELPPLGAGVAVKLEFSIQPRPGVVERPLEVIRVSVVDPAAKIVQRATNEVTLSLGNNPSGARLLGKVTATPILGIADFLIVGLDRPATGYTLVASAADLDSATSEPFAVAAPPLTLVSNGMVGGHVHSLAISPVPPGGVPTIFAAVGNAVYRSTDRGATWTPASFGIIGQALALVADPKASGVVYALGGSNGFLRKTTNNGDVWINAGVPGMGTALAAAVDPIDPSIMYAAAQRLFRSTNGGATWTQLISLTSNCSEIAVDPITTSNLYALIHNSNGSYGVQRSLDSGSSWTAVNSLPPLEFLSVLVATPHALFVGDGNELYRSIDRGDSWTRLADFASIVAYAPSLPTRVYCGCGPRGVAVSHDAGATFGPAVGLDDRVEKLVVDPTDHNRVYAGSHKGVWVSTDGGASWNFSSQGITVPYVTSVAMAPNAPDTLVATTSAGVFHTSNGGATWQQAAARSDGVVRFDLSRPARAYLCSEGTFSISTDSGASFGKGIVAMDSCAGLAFIGNTFFAAGSPGTRKSIDGGASWSDTGIGTYSFSVALGDEQGNVVVSGGSQGIVRSINGGTTFTSVTSEYATSLLVDPATPTRIIAGLGCGSHPGGAQSSGGFRISTDGGANFGPVKPATCIGQLSDDGSALYAAGGFDSYVSTDHGDTWTKFAARPPGGASTQSIAASSDGKTIYFATSAGLYKSTNGGM